MARSLVVALAALALAGCARIEGWEGVKFGATPDEVTAKLGPPLSVEQMKGGVTFRTFKYGANSKNLATVMFAPSNLVYGILLSNKEDGGDKIKAALREEHGTPADGSKPGKDDWAKEALWKKGNVKVTYRFGGTLFEPVAFVYYLNGEDLVLAAK